MLSLAPQLTRILSETPIMNITLPCHRKAAIFQIIPRLQAEISKLQLENSQLRTQNATLQEENAQLKNNNKTLQTFQLHSSRLEAKLAKLETTFSSFQNLFSQFNLCCVTCSVGTSLKLLSKLFQNNFNLTTASFSASHPASVWHYPVSSRIEIEFQSAFTQSSLGFQLGLTCLPFQRYFFSRIEKIATWMKTDRDILLAHYLQDIASSSVKKTFVNVSIHVSIGSSTSSDSLSRNPLPDLLHDNVDITISRTFRDTTLGYQLKDALFQDDTLFDVILQADNETNRSRLKQLLHNSVVVPQLTHIPLAHQAISLSQIGTSLFTLHWDECAYISSLNPISSSSSPSSSSNNPQAQIDSLFNTMNSVILDEEQDTWSTFITSAVSMDTSRLFIPYYKLKQLAAETHHLQSTIPNSQALLDDAKNTDAKGIPMQIRVKTLMERTFTLDVFSLDTVSQLKEKIYNKEGIPTCQQCLRFAYPPLDDDRTLADCNITNKSTLHLISNINKK